VSDYDASARLNTARALLSPDRVGGVTLEERRPDPPLEELGALLGFGAVTPGHDVRVSVYVLDSWGAGLEHEDALVAAAEAVGRHGMAAVNGELFFIGTAPLDDRKAKRILTSLCSAFAGWE
jgi:hypothetical protein